MVNDRPYHKRMPEELARDYLESQSGTNYDPEIVAVFIEMLINDRFSDLTGKK